MTGKRPQTTGVTGYAEHARIADELNTLPNLLRMAGYQTASIGRSMHTYPHYRRYGFEVVEHNQDLFYRRHPHIKPMSDAGGIWSDWPHLQEHGLPVNGVSARPWHLNEQDHETNTSIRSAIEFLDRRDRESPFFMYVGTVAPHPPLLPPACYYDRYDRYGMRAPAVGDWAGSDRSPLLCPPTTQPPTSASAPRLILDGQQRRSTLAGYYGLINHFDDQLQLLLARLECDGIMRNTYILFTSDHGEMLGDHHCFRKSLPYEGSAHIPLMLRGPTIDPGTVVDQPVVLMDILPTCCDIAGIQVPDTIEGRSLLPTTRGENLGRPFVHGTHGAMRDCHDGFHYLTDGRFKYIWWVGPGREQLFDLDNDACECHDLTTESAHKDQLVTMRNALIDMIANAPEGFVQDGQLVGNIAYGSTNSHAVLTAINASTG